jgi:hypothetical protein
MIGMLGLRDSALHDGIMCHLQVVYSVSLLLMTVQSPIPFIDIPTLFTLFSLCQLQLIPVITVLPIHWSYCSVLCASPLSVVCCPQRVTVFHIASFINLLMPGLVSSKGVIPPIMVGMYPQLSLNRANPVKLLTFEFMASSVISS